jgi:hypothetical protein
MPNNLAIYLTALGIYLTVVSLDFQKKQGNYKKTPFLVTLFLMA